MITNPIPINCITADKASHIDGWLMDDGWCVGVMGKDRG
jgi:hypothetical protein